MPRRSNWRICSGLNTASTPASTSSSTLAECPTDPDFELTRCAGGVARSLHRDLAQRRRQRVARDAEVRQHLGALRVGIGRDCGQQLAGRDRRVTGLALGPAQRGVQRGRAQVAFARHPQSQLGHPGPEQVAVDREDLGG